MWSLFFLFALFVMLRNAETNMIFWQQPLSTTQRVIYLLYIFLKQTIFIGGGNLSLEGGSGGV